MTTAHPKKHGWPFWFAFTLIVLMVYVLSYGVWAWLWWRGFVPDSAVLSGLYYPFTWAMISGPDPVKDAVKWYAELWH